MGTHVCAAPASHPRQLSCETCGRFVNPADLRTIGFGTFTGGQSINPRVTAFLNSGEPGVLNPDVYIDGTGISG